MPADANVLLVSTSTITSTGVIVGIVRSLTAGSRALRKVEWLSSMLDSERDTSRRDALVRMKLQNQGYLVADDRVPVRYFVALMVLASVFPIVIFYEACRRSPTLPISNFIIGFLVTTLCMFFSVRLYREKKLIMRQFELGGIRIGSTNIDVRFCLEGNFSQNFLLGLTISVFVLIVSAAASFVGAENVKSGVLILVLFEGVVALMSYLIVHSYIQQWVNERADG